MAGARPSGTDRISEPADTLVDVAARSPNLDILRAVAATMVLLCHAYLLGGRYLILTPDGSTTPGGFLGARWTIDALLGFCTSGVWLFFALSGYLISKPFVRALVTGQPLPGLIPYSVRRVARIYPLYWVALAATLLIVGTGVTQRREVPFHFLLVQNLVAGEQDKVVGVAWTLTLELLFYAAVPLLALLIARLAARPISPGKLATLVVGAWLASIVWTMAAAWVGDQTYRYWLRGVLPSMFGMFCPGILLAIAEHDLGGSRWRRWLQDLPYRRWALVLAGALLAAAGVISAGVRAPDVNISFLTGEPSSRHPGVLFYVAYDAARPLFAIGYGILLGWAIRARPWGGQFRAPLVEFGLISYGIYLIHAVWVEAMLTTDWGQAMIPLPHGGAFAYLVHVLFLLGLTLPLAWLAWRLLERPILRRAIRFGNDVQTRRRARGAPDAVAPAQPVAVSTTPSGPP